MLQVRKPIYFHDRNVLKPLTEEQERELLIIALKEGNDRARDELICRNLRLVCYICRKFSNSSIELEELISIGTIGLIKGLDSYDIEKEIKLSTYVSRCIENEILQVLRRDRKTKNDISLEESITTDWDGNELKVKDIVEVEEEEYKRYEDMEEVSIILEYILNSFKTREKRIILLQLANVTQAEIGIELGLSQSYVSRVSKSLQKKMFNLKFNVKKNKASRYTIKVVKDKYRISVSCTKKEKKAIEEMLKEKATYECGKIIIDFILDEEMYKLLASLVKLLEE